MATTGRSAHTPLVDDRHPLRALLQGGRFESPVGFVVGFAIAACGGLALTAGIAAAVSDQRQVLEFVVLGGLWTGIGGLLIHQCRVPHRLRASVAFLGVFVTWITLVAVSVITYEVLDVFDYLDDALFESIAGFTTTASSVVASPEGLGRGVLFWRAGTQWLGGLGALLFVVAILPSIGVGGLDVTDAGHRHRGTSLRSRRTVQQLQRLAGVYAALSGIGVVLFLVGGMSPFDALTYAMTTISTGGFTNHAGSFAHFESDLLEWAGVGGMLLGGTNMVLVFRSLRGDPTPLLRSMELSAYAAIIAVGSVIAAIATAGPDGLTHDGVRRAVFHVTSAASTTGHYAGGWANWDPGPQVVLLAIMGIGAMSGSAGSGFRVVRVLTLVGFLRRELVTQLHPRAVLPVGVGRKVVPDAVAARMVGYQAQYLIVVAAAAIAVATLGGELVTSIGAAISAMANVGPGIGDLTPAAGGVHVLPRPARAVLMPVMLLGRLEIAPALVGAAMATAVVRDRVRGLWYRFGPADEGDR